MAVEYFDVEQNTPEWYALRCGIPTASNFKSILASSAEMRMRKGYMNRLAAEIITGDPLDSYKNADMGRGHVQEPDARRNYSILTDTEPKLVGFARNGRAGCSPDALIGDDGVLEIKTQNADLLIDTIRADVFPAAHVAQCQGALWVTGRAWVDLVVYAPKMPLFVKRAVRDDSYIAKLAREVEQFLADVDKVVESIKAYGRA